MRTHLAGENLRSPSDSHMNRWRASVPQSPSFKPGRTLTVQSCDTETVHDTEQRTYMDSQCSTLYSVKDICL